MRDYGKAKIDIKELHQENKKLHIDMKFERTNRVLREHHRENEEIQKEMDYWKTQAWENQGKIAQREHMHFSISKKAIKYLEKNKKFNEMIKCEKEKHIEILTKKESLQREVQASK